MPEKVVLVEFIAETRKLMGGMKKVDRKVGLLTKGFKRLGGAIAAAFGARAVISGLVQTVKSSEALIKTAKGVGFTAGEYERLTFALSQVGVEASAARIALGDFQKRLAKPQFHKFFREAGLDPKALQKLSPADAFNTAFAHLATLVNDPRAADFFGTVFEEQAGKNMLQAARSMGDFTDAYKQYARIAGKGITEGDAASFEELGKQARILGLRMTVLRRKIVVDALPQILEALEKLEAADAFKKMADSIIELIDNISKLAGILPGLSRGKAEFDHERGRLGGEIKKRGFFKAMFDSETGEDPISRLLNAGQGRMGEFLSDRPIPAAPVGAPALAAGGFGGNPINITQHNKFAYDAITNAKLEKMWKAAQDKATRAAAQ